MVACFLRHIGKELKRTAYSSFLRVFVLVDRFLPPFNFWSAFISALILQFPGCGVFSLLLFFNSLLFLFYIERALLYIDSFSQAPRNSSTFNITFRLPGLGLQLLQSRRKHRQAAVSEEPVPIASEDTTMDDPEKMRQELNSSNPRGNSNIYTGVDVASAEAEFQELGRQLTELSKTTSRQTRKISRTQSRVGGGDPEKAGVEEEEDGGQFDLEGHLRGNQSADREAGIRPKHIGIYLLSFFQSFSYNPVFLFLCEPSEN